MRSLLSAVGAIVVLAGCATTPVSSNNAKEAPPERLLAFQEKLLSPSGILTVTRDVGFLGSGCFYAVSINGITAARLDVGEKSTFYVSPGEVVLRAGRDPEGKALCGLGQDEWTQRETLLRSDEKKYFRMSIDANGKSDIQRANH
jgi:hypothetical protein